MVEQKYIVFQIPQYSHTMKTLPFLIYLCVVYLYDHSYISRRWVSVMFLAKTFTVLFKVRRLVVLA